MVEIVSGFSGFFNHRGKILKSLLGEFQGFVWKFFIKKPSININN